MNLSSDILQRSPGTPSMIASGFSLGIAHASSISKSYVPMEYREAVEPISLEECSPEQPAEAAGSVETTEPQPDPAELFEERLQEERRLILAHARKEGDVEIQRARTAVAGAIEQFAQQREEYFRQAEGEIVSLALAIARRLIHRECQIDPQLLSGLVRHELEQLEMGTSVRLLVTPESVNHWNEVVRTMSHTVEVSGDKSLSPGSARIETALGSTTVCLEYELKEIERGFFDLLSRRPVVSGSPVSETANGTASTDTVSGTSTTVRVQ